MARTGRPPAGRITVACAAPQCGNTMEKFPSVVASSKTGRFFCSMACRDLVGSKPKTGEHRECKAEGCTEQVYVRKSDTRKVFCSKTCRDRSNVKDRSTFICENPECGKPFEVLTSQAQWNANRFCSRECHYAVRVTPLGTRKKNSDGYVMVYAPDEPGAHATGWILEHRLVMQRAQGKSLPRHVTPHHINGQRDDNRIENLEPWSSSQPAGQRIDDKSDWAEQWLATHRPESLTPAVRAGAKILD